MPFKNRKQKLTASTRRAEFDIASSSFRWEGRAVEDLHKAVSRHSAEVDMATTDTHVMKKDLLTILVLCLLIIGAQIAISLTLL